jgi:hypothetical protein
MILLNTVQVKTLGSLLMTIIQIVNCNIKYTVVQIPFCLKILGLFYGSMAIGLVGLMSIFSVYMLIVVKETTGEQ